MKILLTGCAGFIGYHVAKALLERGDDVIGLDSLNEYYDINLKLGRLSELGIKNESYLEGKTYLSSQFDNFRFY